MRRGKTGCCPYSVVATLVAVPALINRGSFSQEKEIRPKIWLRRGPWAARSYAAALFAECARVIPKSRHWAARNLYVKNPNVPRRHQAPGLLR